MADSWENVNMASDQISFYIRILKIIGRVRGPFDILFSSVFLYAKDDTKDLLKKMIRLRSCMCCVSLQI